jgi:Fe-Mn family superoxide dismutase
MNIAAVSSRPIVQPPLPYEQNALNPVISANTVAVHYGKHHKTYVDTANKLIVGTEHADMPLEWIVRSSAGRTEHADGAFVTHPPSDGGISCPPFHGT